MNKFFDKMQLQLLLEISQHSELCCARLHVIPRFARYVACNKKLIMKAHVRAHNEFSNTTNNETRYMSFKKLHRVELDSHGRIKPAVICKKYKLWFKNNKMHRTERDEFGYVLPAAIYSDGEMMWCCEHEFHRTDRDAAGHVLPAVIDAEHGTKYWYRNDKLHRECRDAHGDLLPAVEHLPGFGFASEFWLYDTKFVKCNEVFKPEHVLIM